MALQSGIRIFKDTNITSELVGSKSFTLPALSSTANLTDPQDSTQMVTARAVCSNVAGTLLLFDPYGNQTSRVVLAGDCIEGLCNAVNESGGNILASDVTIVL